MNLNLIQSVGCQNEIFFSFSYGRHLKEKIFFISKQEKKTEIASVQPIHSLCNKTEE